MSRKKPANVPKFSQHMSQIDLAQLGGGEVGYIRVLSSEEVVRQFPAVEGIPPGVTLFALYGADGSPIALTDSRHAALGHALEGNLCIAAIH